MGLFSLKSDKTKLRKLKEEGCVVTLALEVPSGEVETHAQTALARLQQSARLPGFRVGKAPLDVVKRHFSSHAREEALNAVLRKHVPAAIQEFQLRTVDVPSVEDIQWTEGSSLSFQVRVEVAPVPSARDYVKIPVLRRPRAADESAVAKRLEELREAHARLEASSAEVVGPTHFAVVDFQAFRDGKRVPSVRGNSELVDMSSEQSVEGLTVGLKGMRRAETKTLQVKLGGQRTDLEVTVKEIKAKVLPPLDADFAKDLGFETLAALKDKLKEVLDRETAAAADAEEVRQIEEALVRANRFALPPSLVERQLEGMLERMSRRFSVDGKIPPKVLEDLRAKLAPRAEDEVRLAFVLSAIADKEKIGVADTEIQAELEAGLKDARDETGKKKLREAFEARKEAISLMIRERKTMAFLRERAVYKDA